MTIDNSFQNRTKLFFNGYLIYLYTSFMTKKYRYLPAKVPVLNDNNATITPLVST